MMENVYLPQIGRIAGIREETQGARAIKTFQVEFPDGDAFEHQCGQCAMLSVFGRGESMISIASSPLVKEYKQFSIMKMGRVTSAFHAARIGDFIGVRGPFGNQFPLADWKGRDLVFVGGGVGLAPMWGALQTAVARSQDYGKISLFYGARTAGDLMYKADIEALQTSVAVQLSVDNPEEGWQGYTGFVPANLMEKAPSSNNAIAITCGPPIMIKFVLQNLKALGFADEQIYTTLENKMKCGIGKCGRCNLGKDYVCTKGPVYSWAELKKLPQEY